MSWAGGGVGLPDHAVRPGPARMAATRSCSPSTTVICIVAIALHYPLFGASWPLCQNAIELNPLGKRCEVLSAACELWRTTACKSGGPALSLWHRAAELSGNGHVEQRADTICSDSGHGSNQQHACTANEGVAAGKQAQSRADDEQRDAGDSSRDHDALRAGAEQERQKRQNGADREGQE